MKKNANGTPYGNLGDDASWGPEFNPNQLSISMGRI